METNTYIVFGTVLAGQNVAGIVPLFFSEGRHALDIREGTRVELGDKGEALGIVGERNNRELQLPRMLPAIKNEGYG